MSVNPWPELVRGDASVKSLKLLEKPLTKRARAIGPYIAVILGLVPRIW
mgnify:CR=1 FL=1